MIKILFICHGNICRSPMAEFIIKKYIKEKNLEDKIYVESAATTTDEIGSAIYSKARKTLIAHGIDGFDEKRARQVVKEDYDKFDLLLIMDDENVWGLKRIIKEDPEKKIHKILDYVGIDGEVGDPWYTGEFETTYRQLDKACKLIVDTICDTMI